MSLPRRSFLFCVVVATAFLFGGRAFAANAPSPRVAGAIKAANIQGTVKKVNLVDKSEVDLKAGDVLIEQNAIVTIGDSSVVLVFANGSTVKVGRESRLEISKFLIDPRGAAQQNVAAMPKEPTTSETDLRLEFGEIVGNVKTLDRAGGSTFKVTTPAGAAGIRGTTFRIVYRPTGTGQAFFQLSTQEGVVLYEGTATVGAATAVDVPANQEVVVNAVIDPVTNTLTITAPPTTASPISAAALVEIQTAVVTIVQTQQQTTFTQIEFQQAQTQQQQQQQQQAPPPPPPTQQAPQTTPGAGANPNP